MRKFLGLSVAAATIVVAGAASAQEMGIFRNGPDGNPRALSDNVKVFGAIDYGESCSYDPATDLIVMPDRGLRTREGGENDGWVSLFNHDGSANTMKWIRADGEPFDTSVAWINEPYGSDIVNGILYIGDETLGGDGPNTGVVTMWDMSTGEMIGKHVVEGSQGVNDLEVDPNDGTIFTTWHGSNDDPTTWGIWRIDADGTVTEVVAGEPSKRPNGIVIDPDGNFQVVNLMDEEIATYTRDGELLKTEMAPEGRNDGLVLMPDGTRYISSVSYGSLMRVGPDGSGEILAVGIPSAASTCYDEGANQLVTPMNNNGAMAYYSLN